MLSQAGVDAIRAHPDEARQALQDGLAIELGVQPNTVRVRSIKDSSGADLAHPSLVEADAALKVQFKVHCAGEGCTEALAEADEAVHRLHDSPGSIAATLTVQLHKKPDLAGVTISGAAVALTLPKHTEGACVNDPAWASGGKHCSDLSPSQCQAHEAAEGQRTAE